MALLKSTCHVSMSKLSVIEVNVKGCDEASHISKEAPGIVRGPRHSMQCKYSDNIQRASRTFGSGQARSKGLHDKESTSYEADTVEVLVIK